ncbi:hypothetical protein AB0F65_02500 [Nocardia rhamnosiphila]|uniref:hypothetical protein n=1 Tax=Nocardia rhamnosiphila TaxID=426716 RepID=UPI0033EE9EF3
MDPVSIGAAAALLIATTYGEEVARNAGASTWNAVQRLRELTANRFRHEPIRRTAISSLSETPTTEGLAIVAEYLDEAAESDPTFAREIQELIEDAQHEVQGTSFTARAFDQARQINVVGNNSGPITLS